MAKPFVGYALARDTYGGDYRVLGVVSEARRILYGRWVDTDAVTNVSERSVLLRYDSAAAATQAIARVHAARTHHQPLLEAARAAERKACAERDAAMLAAARPCKHPTGHQLSSTTTTWCDICELPISADLTVPFPS